MKKVYAYLIGNWVCLNDDPECVIGHHHQKPGFWWEEDLPVYAPFASAAEDRTIQLNYVDIYYHGKNYRIDPAFIQIVNE